MTTYIVTKVRMELSRDGSHEHVEGVCTDGGRHYTRQQVVDSISAGDVWLTSVDGRRQPIGAAAGCPAPGCDAAPYLRGLPENGDGSDFERLESC